MDSVRIGYWNWIIVLGLWLIFWVASQVFIWAVGISVLVEMLSSLAHKQSIMNLPGNWVVLFQQRFPQYRIQ